VAVELAGDAVPAGALPLASYIALLASLLADTAWSVPPLLRRCVLHTARCAGPDARRRRYASECDGSASEQQQQQQQQQQPASTAASAARQDAAAPGGPLEASEGGDDGGGAGAVWFLSADWGAAPSPHDASGSAAAGGAGGVVGAKRGRDAMVFGESGDTKPSAGMAPGGEGQLRAQLRACLGRMGAGWAALHCAPAQAAASALVRSGAAWRAAPLALRSALADMRCRRPAPVAPPPLPSYYADTLRPSPRTKWTRRVRHPVLFGHADVQPPEPQSTQLLLSAVSRRALSVSLRAP
jgi:hypothetical protein